MAALLFLFVGSIIVVLIACSATKEDKEEVIYEVEEEEPYFAKPREMDFADYIGQERHTQRIQKAIEYAKSDTAPMKHFAIVGSAGTGKTALACCVSTESSRRAMYTTGQAIDSVGTLEAMIAEVGGGILFIDEAQDMKLAEGVETAMLPLLEDFVLSTALGSSEVEPFTCILATTDWGSVHHAIRSRMGLPYELDPYTDDDMAKIVQSHAKRMELSATDDAARYIGKRSRQNPRYSALLLTEARNHSTGTITCRDCEKAFKLLDIDEHGLKMQDRRLLELLALGKCAKSRCAGYLGMDVKTFESTVATYMFNQGLISVGSRGWEITDKGKQYIGVSND